MDTGYQCFYGPRGRELFVVNPRCRGAEITIVKLSPEGESTHSMTLTRQQFQQLLTDGAGTLQKIDELRDEAMRKRGYPI
ncbi:hypothetical protein SAMN05421805_104418 [Saccharopolyspora antimicrobica]|uniref:Uncharacterized protein n=1 Tax=Saccharopolyspora antimicrobica TaxID=455193 RepID=A0A1I4Z5P2_9PSEU|nr:hypothetical protein [Saccharopolyspora antimicrobica]RKT82938.1 hypothetical protein ATL45_1201 [Saccharopolyspora antimicrobica]SFN45596.1 hypothetical protein SAMN05421805_104418 [Saccharopolyspora antimicrobica]